MVIGRHESYGVERDARRRSNGSGIRIRRSWRSRLNSLRYRVMRWLEGTMTRRPQLIDAVYRAGNQETARIILSRAIAEGFVIECLEPHKHQAKITYSFNAERLRTQVTGE